MKKPPFLLSSVLALFLAAAPALAAPSYFLQLAGIDGDSTVKGYEQWIEVESYAFEIGMEAGAGDATSRTPTFSDFSVSKRIDGASTPIFQHLVTGTPIATASFEVAEIGAKLPTRLITYSFTEVLFERFEHAASDHASPLELVAFSFAEIGLQTYEQDATGGSKPAQNFTWDLRTAQSADAAPAVATPLPPSALLLLSGLLVFADSARRRPQAHPRRR